MITLAAAVFTVPFVSFAAWGAQPLTLTPTDTERFNEVFFGEDSERNEIVMLAPAVDGSSDGAIAMWSEPLVRAFAIERRFMLYVIPEEQSQHSWRRILDVEDAPAVIFRRRDGRMIVVPMGYFQSSEHITRWLGECRAGRSRVDELRAAMASNPLGFHHREELRREHTLLGEHFEADMLIGGLLINIDAAAAGLSPDDPERTVRRVVADIARIRLEHGLVARDIPANPNRPQDPTRFGSWIEEHDWRIHHSFSGYQSERERMSFHLREVLRELVRRNGTVGLTVAEQAVLEALNTELPAG